MEEKHRTLLDSLDRTAANLERIDRSTRHAEEDLAYESSREAPRPHDIEDLQEVIANLAMQRPRLQEELDALKWTLAEVTEKVRQEVMEARYSTDQTTVTTETESTGTAMLA